MYEETFLKKILFIFCIGTADATRNAPQILSMHDMIHKYVYSRRYSIVYFEDSSSALLHASEQGSCDFLSILIACDVLNSHNENLRLIVWLSILFT